MKAYAVLHKVFNQDMDEDFANAWVDSIYFNKDKAKVRMNELAGEIEKDAFEPIDCDDYEAYVTVKESLRREEYEDSIVVNYSIHDCCHFTFEIKLQEVEIQ